MSSSPQTSQLDASQFDELFRKTASLEQKMQTLEAKLEERDNQETNNFTEMSPEQQRAVLSDILSANPQWKAIKIYYDGFIRAEATTETKDTSTTIRITMEAGATTRCRLEKTQDSKTTTHLLYTTNELKAKLTD